MSDDTTGPRLVEDIPSEPGQQSMIPKDAPIDRKAMANYLRQLDAIEDEMRDLRKQRRAIRERIKAAGIDLGPFDVVMRLRKIEDESGVDVINWEEGYKRARQLVLTQVSDQQELAI